VQFGDFHFGRPLETLPQPRTPMLLALPVNNYWDTNPPRAQYGGIHLRYVSWTFKKADLAAICGRAEKFRQPFLACNERGSLQG
jgi:alpha-mannosidase